MAPIFRVIPIPVGFLPQQSPLSSILTCTQWQAGSAVVAQIWFSRSAIGNRLLQPFFGSFTVHFPGRQVYIQHVINEGKGVLVKSHADAVVIMVIN
jgi:hypothetical protein